MRDDLLDAEEYDSPITIRELETIACHVLEFEYSFNTPISDVLDEISVYFDEHDLFDAVIQSATTSEFDLGYVLEIVYSI